MRALCVKKKKPITAILNDSSASVKSVLINQHFVENVFGLKVAYMCIKYFDMKFWALI